MNIKGELIGEYKRHEKDATYLYRLIKLTDPPLSSFVISLYSVRIEMKMKDKLTFYQSGGLLVCERKAERLLQFLADNLITPTNLPFIIEDLFDF